MPLQTMGTHNSYHVAPPPSVIALLQSPFIVAGLGSAEEQVPDSWQVTQAPLTQQLGNYGEHAKDCWFVMVGPRNIGAATKGAP